MKRRISIRIISLFLVCIMLAAVLAACGNTGNDGNSTTDAVSGVKDSSDVSGNGSDVDSDSPESGVRYDAEGFIMDDIPESTNFNQADIAMLYWSDVENPEFFVDSENGDLVGQAIFTRNSRVESRLNVTITYDGQPGNNDNNDRFLTAARTAADGGTSYDIYAAYSMTTANLAYNGLCENLLDFDAIDLDKPWWPDSLITEATINNKLYFASGDLSTNLLYMMYVLYFNKKMIAEKGLDDPYQCVDNKDWTYEKMFNMSNVISDSVNAGDTNKYGFVANSSVHLDPFFYGAGLRTTEHDPDGKPIISPSFGSERANSVVEDVWAFLNKPGCTISKGRTIFAEEKALFIMDRARYASQNLASAGNFYGIVPVPKYTADQENYTTCMGFPYTLYAISEFSSQKEEAAVVLECLGSEGYRNITPALFEISMKERYVSDGNATRMFDIIREGVSFELGRIFTYNLNRLTYSLYRSEFVREGGSQYASSFESSKTALDNLLANLIKNFE